MALILGASAVIAVIAPLDWNLTGLVRMEDTDEMALVAYETDPDFIIYDAGHYDGVYYYAIARDPFATGIEHEKIDEAAYRYGHAGYGWFGWIFSAGQETWVPGALLFVALSGLAIAAGAGSLLATKWGMTPWLGLAVALNPGLIFSAATLTSEPLGAALLMLSFLFWTLRKWVAAAITIALLCLVKEWFLALPLAFVVFELARSKNERWQPDPRARRLVVLAGPAVFALWYVYLTIRFGILPFVDGTDNLSFPPLSGWVDSLQRVVHWTAETGDTTQLGLAAIPLLVAAAGVLIFGIVAAMKLRTPADPLFAIIAIVVLSGTWLTIAYPKDLLRTMTLPLLLLPFVLAHRSTPAEDPT